MARGVAAMTPENLNYLESCDAVTKIEERPDRIDFMFDPAKQPTSGVPDGVFFCMDESPF